MEQKRKYKYPFFLVIIIFIVIYFLTVILTGFTYYQLISSIKSKVNVTREKQDNYVKHIKEAQTFNKEKKDQEALSASQKALTYARSDAQKAQANYWIGMSYLFLDDYTKAQESAEKSISQDPKNPYAYDILVGVNIKNKNYDKALENSQKLVKALPGYDQGYADLAESYYYLGDKESAIKYINTAIKLNPKAEYHKESLKFYEGEPTVNNTAPNSTLLPEDKDPNYWKTQLGYMNDDKGKLEIITGNSKYNQDKIAQEKVMLNQRINIITPIYNKLAAGQTLNSSDAQAINTYWSITERYYALADEILAGK